MCFFFSLLFTNMSALQKHPLDKIVSTYEVRMSPRGHEKRHYGEVFTPFDLINKLLDHIPKSIMNNPDSIFLDPSAGIGGFLLILYKRLMTTLQDNIPDEKQRREHIVSKMLIAAELTKDNVEWMRKVFGKKLRVYHGDALSMDLEKFFGIQKVNVIVGNPPFEKPQIKQTRLKIGGDTLWTEFVTLSLRTWLKDKGIFAMLLPPGWRKPSDDKSRSHDIWKLMTRECTPLWIEMHDARDSSVMFNKHVSIRFDLVVVEKVPNKGRMTIMHGTDGASFRADLRGIPFLPNGHLCYWRSIMTLDKKKAVRVIYSRSSYSSEKKELLKSFPSRSYKYPVVHSLLKDGSLNTLYSNKKITGFVPKVMFNKFGAWNKPVLDLQGKYGMTESVFAIPISSKKEGTDIIRFFSDDKCRNMYQDDLMWATSRPSLFWKMFYFIRKDFYKYLLSDTCKFKIS